jgi:L-alanine-DL-glutamate epimerase-like enolase superfamily enzyme
MKISRIVDLHADAGWRVFSFLKIETDAGLIGWSEYNESYGSKGLTVVITKLAEMLIGQDPRPVELITANLYARTRQAPGGLIQQAIAAIENALVDVKAKALGVPVCEMLGGPVRDRLRRYWSHCGTYRLHHAEKDGPPADPHPRRHRRVLLIREASREHHFGEVDGHFVLRSRWRVHRVMGRFPQANALLLAYASAATAMSPYSLPAAQLLGCPPSPACKGPRRPHWSNECSRRTRSCR